MKRQLMGLLLMLVAVSLWAGTLKFKAQDSEGVGEAFATVRIYAAADTTRAVVVDVTDVDGMFSATLPDGDYKLEVSAVGKSTATRQLKIAGAVDLGSIEMRSDNNVLEGVTVTAQRPLITNEIDRIGYDVQADSESKTLTAMDMLRKVPLVSVDAQDNIRVKGGTSFKIYKNGHPDPAMSNNAKEVLKAIPASMIKKIEVITEPGAKYDAEGVSAILNIVTVSTTGTSGVTGSVGAGVTHQGQVRANGYLTTQLGKVVANVNYGYVMQPRRSSRQLTEQEYDYVDTGEHGSTRSEGDAHVGVHYGNIEASYEPDTLNLVTFNFGGYYYNYKGDALSSYTRSNAAGELLYSYKNNYRTPLSSYYSFDGRLDYQHRTSRPSEIFTLSYLISTSRNRSNSDNSYYETQSMPVPYTTMSQRRRETFLEQTAQADWTRPLTPHHKFETGVKYINRSNRSTTVAHYDAGTADVDSRFNHTTHVAAAYASYTYSSDKWNARAGLRYEYSYLKAAYPDGSQASFHRSLSDWVPSATVSYQFDMSRSLKAAFATRINRPGISYLNPAVVENVNEVSYGNPTLGSARTYNVSLTYMQVGPKLTFNIVPSFSSSTNDFTEVKFTDDAGRDVTTYANAMVFRQFSVSGFLQWQLHAKTSLMFNGSISHNYLRSSSLGLKNKRWGTFFYAQLTQKLPWKLRLTASGGKWGGEASDLYSHSGHMWFHSLSLQRSFLKEDRLTVSLRAQNPFGGKYMTFSSYYTGGDYTGYNQFKSTHRMFMLNISYRFGSLKASVKKTATTIDNSDLVGGNAKSVSE